MAPGMRPLIQLRERVKVYHLGDVEVRALRGISLDIRAGEFWRSERIGPVRIARCLAARAVA